MTVAGLGVAFLLGMAASRGRAQFGQEHLPAPSASKKAEEVYKNIQVLNGAPSDQLLPAMQFITASLGVQCDYCHVPGAFDKDDLKTKQTARQMMRMMFAVNKDTFAGKREVTCYTCHRGSTAPVPTPLIADHEPMASPHAGHDPNQATGGAPPVSPGADQILENYVRALGGADAIRKISSRTQKGTITAFGGRQFPLEVFAKAPDKRLSVMHLPGGDSLTVFDGQRGWLGAAHRDPREMTPSEVEAARFDADFYFPLRARQYFSEIEPEPQEKVGEREANVVLGKRPGQPAMKLYFDAASGLLVRVVRYAETPLGRNPTQIDYGDYRDTGGVRLPYRWTIARPAGRFTTQIESVEQNVAIDDSRFAKPAAADVISH